MLDINLIRQNPEKVKEGIEKKGTDPKLVDRFLRFDEKWREISELLGKLQAEQNKISKEIAGDKSSHLLSHAHVLKKRIAEVKSDRDDLEKKREEVLEQLPNLPFDDVPVGKDESGNVVLRKVGNKKDFDFKFKDYLALGESLDLIDMKTAAEVSGSRFSYLKRDAALLEFALVQYTLATLSNEKDLTKIAKRFNLEDVSVKPFIPVIPPQMVKAEVMKKMARLEPKEERYHIPSDDLYLVGSAEHSLGPMHMDQVFSKEDLPIRYLGFSTSFRREAGSYGKDTKGILRVHQFDKLEMESFCLPEASRKEQEFFVACQEYLMQELEIPYQVVEICTGDMGAPDARQIDIEAWLPSENRYRETHTADLMTDYQARRLGTKVRLNNKTEFVHMIDATAFAIGRTLIAILENYQTEEGTVKVPKALQKYVGKKEIKR
ncbi:MAG: serine--tRNA ligase [Candidatus Jorgensenbacteria bacterium]